MNGAFTYLLLPHLWSSRNRARRRERGDFTRGLMFGCVGVAVFGRDRHMGSLAGCR